MIPTVDDRRIQRQIALRVVAAVDASKGVSEGIAALDTDGKVPVAQLPEQAAATITIDASGFSGKLAGSGITTVQELAAWLDANLP